jgi:predicted permease
MLETLTALKHLLSRLFRRRQLEQDLQDELDFHIAMREDQLRGAGDRTPKTTARKQFGNTTRLREDCREVWTFQFFERWWTDLRYAVKGLNQNKAWTGVAVISLGVGIGINTGVLRITLNAHPELPVKNPEELVAFHFGSQKAGPKEGFWRLTSIAEFKALQSANQTLTDLFAFSNKLPDGNIIVSGQGETVDYQYVTGNYFKALGITPALGRGILPDDDRPAAAPVGVISYSYWSRRFHRDPSVPGTQVVMNRQGNIGLWRSLGQPVTIIGVLPDGLIDPSGLSPDMPDIQLPIALVPPPPDSTIPGNPADQTLDPRADTPVVYQQPSFWLKMPNFDFLSVMGRRKADVSLAQIQANFSERAGQAQKAEWDAFLSRLTPEERSDPYLNGNRRNWAHAYIVPGNRGVADPDPKVRRDLIFITTVAGIALLMVCMNLANHLLARAASRQQELAVRAALGASRARLLRQLLTETAVLSVFAAIVAIPVSYWPSLALSAWLAPGEPVPQLHAMDWRILGLNFGLALIAGWVATAGPAFRTIAMNARGGLQGDMTPFSGARLLPRILLITQVAVSIVLLVVAGLFVKAVRNIREVKLGFNPANVAVFTIDPSGNGYNSTRSAEIEAQIVQKLLLTPGVESATLSDRRIDEFAAGNRGKTRVITGREDTAVERCTVDVGFFTTLQIPLRLGRAFTASDDLAGPPVAVVNEAFVRTFFKTPNPVGEHIRYGGDEKHAHDAQIVGVVGDVKTGQPEDADKPMLFTPHSQSPFGPRTFEVRTRAEPNELQPAIRSVVRSVDPTLPISGMFSHAFLTESRIAGDQLVLGPILRLVGGLVFAFAMIGVFSLMSYKITQRTKEIGIRMAIGAERRRVLLSVMWETQRLVLYGVFIGIPAALGAATALQLQFFGLSAADPGTMIGIILFTFAVASIAGYVPARRASRVDPMVALRHD